MCPMLAVSFIREGCARSRAVMNKATITLVLLALVGGVGATLLWSGDELSDLRPTAPEAVPEGVADTAGEELATPASAEVDTESAGEAFPADFLRAEAEVDDAESGRPLVLQVWHGRKGVPAPAAEVFMLDGSDGAKKGGGDPFAPHVSSQAETKGKRFEQAQDALESARATMDVITQEEMFRDEELAKLGDQRRG